MHLSLGELGEATHALANAKCVGPDGTLVEFFKAYWPVVGPLVLQCITQGIEEECFPEFLTKGAIVLLKKKADQRLLANKRPITLLNTIYKIHAKAMKRGLTPILHRIISPQQSAFLPGGNIHHSLLLLSEMLQQAHLTGEDYILMKLDVHKAFETMDWTYILATVERAGMNGMLFRFLKAIFSSTSSNIILNGRPTEAFKLARSVRQGCPLSPLIFILGLDHLSHLMNDAMERQAIVGIRFPQQGVSNILAMYADDTNIMIKAKLHFVMAIKAILELFEMASGLCFVWEKTKAAYIPRARLPWPSGYCRGLGKRTLMLPISLAFQSPVVPLHHSWTNVHTRITTGICKLEKHQLSLAGRVLAANSLVLSTIWYILTLWAGDLAFLTKLQRLIEAFVWAGRPWVNRDKITQCEANGGFGLF